MITSLLGDPGATGPSRSEGIARDRGEELILPDGKPNIVVIWGDDIGITNLSCYSDGLMGYRTPSIDRLADEGMRFTDSYGEQSCTAGRAAFITGQSVYRTGLSKVGLPGAEAGLQAEDPTIAELLKPQGYATGQYGKNHFGDRDEHLPTNHGFDEFFGNLYHLNAEEEPEHEDYPDPADYPKFRDNYGPCGVMRCRRNSDGTQTIEDTGPLTRKRMETIDDEIIDGAVDFIDRRHTEQVPFFVGACWRHPEGPRSTLQGRERHPVVHIAAEDAEAYARSAGKELPTEAEWEFAARCGREGARFVWGDEPERDGQRLANYWHGDFPWRAKPGYGHTTPVGSFPAIGFGLYDMAANVWEWTTDWYAARHPEPAGKPCCVPHNPRGGDVDASYDPAQRQFRIARRVVKGGSFLCADSYCMRYRPAARRPQPVDTGMSHIGFRCVLRSE